MTDNIFSWLSKYNSLADENYLTQSFAFLIRTLLIRDPSSAYRLLNLLCGGANPAFSASDNVLCSTQQKVETGILDIKLSSKGTIVFVEIKEFSEVDPDQLKRYKKALDSERADTKRLVLLTKVLAEPEKHLGIPDQCVLWRNVSEWLQDVRYAAEDPVSGYLIDSFRQFLEAKGMSIGRVGWEYIAGVSALNNLVGILIAAMEDTGHRISSIRQSADYRGYYFDDGEFWCGISWERPLFVIFEPVHAKKFDTSKVPKTTYQLEKTDALWFLLPLEERHFFSLDGEGQLAEMTSFVKSSYEDAEKMRIAK